MIVIIIIKKEAEACECVSVMTQEGNPTKPNEPNRSGPVCVCLCVSGNPFNSGCVIPLFVESSRLSDKSSKCNYSPCACAATRYPLPPTRLPLRRRKVSRLPGVRGLGVRDRGREDRGVGGGSSRAAPSVDSLFASARSVRAARSPTCWAASDPDSLSRSPLGWRWGGRSSMLVCYRG